MGRIEIPWQAITVEEADYLLRANGGYIDSRGFVVLEVEEEV